jgi:hypothetical protein
LLAKLDKQVSVEQLTAMRPSDLHTRVSALLQP